jgi:glycosyltransferase involved in cell wall biosynthesis
MDYECKLLFISTKPKNIQVGGRQSLTNLNNSVLKKIYNDRLICLELIPIKKYLIKQSCEIMNGLLDGASKKNVDLANKLISDKKISKIFIDGSNLGGIVFGIKNKYPDIEIITFCHNVEFAFFWGAFKKAKSIKSFLIAFANYLAEKKAVKYSDKIICLNNRDSLKIKKVYGRYATHISAIAINDIFNKKKSTPSISLYEAYALFVGGNFYANRDGIIWFVNNVVKFINIKIVIVGSGMEVLAEKLSSDKVIVVGKVENLEYWYSNAHFVIAPIFDGSGMKTKVAEALMFGKKIIGTPEAFTGYEEFIHLIGWSCKTIEDFVSAISIAQIEITSSFNQDLRNIYINNFSQDSAFFRLKKIVNNDFHQ